MSEQQNTEMPIGGNAPTKCILETKRFIDNAGREIEQAVLVKGEPLPGIAPFVGHAVINVQAPPAPGMPPQQMQIPLQFPIGAASIDEAFGMFDALVQPAADRHMQAIRQQQMDQQSSIIKPPGS